MEDTNKDIKNLEEIINLINKELDKKDKNVTAILNLKDLLSLRSLIKAYKELEKENKKLKAKHIITHNKVNDEEKAKIFDVIDNSIDTYFEKSKPYWEQIMIKDKMSLEEAETIINDMYQDRNKILENNNVIDISRLDDVKFTNLEFASVRAIREIQSIERKLDNSIPVSLIEQKIEELKQKAISYGTFIDKDESFNIQSKISVLQELFKKRK